MSGSRITGGRISQKGFAHLPKIGDSVPGEPQPRGSLDLGSVSSCFSGISNGRAAQLEEGDLVTGMIDITHERAYMLPAIRGEDRVEDWSVLLSCWSNLTRHGDPQSAHLVAGHAAHCRTGVGAGNVPHGCVMIGILFSREVS
jgi:hypothetical protein